MPRARLVPTVILAVLAGLGAGAPAAQAVTFDVLAAGVFPFAEPWDLEYADFDEDGRLDVVVGAGPAGVQVFAGQPDGGLELTFTASPSFPTALLSVAAPADVTGDGRLDIVYTRAGEVIVRAGDGAGGFAAEVVTPLAQASAVDTGDFDGDGRADVVAGRSGTWVCCPDDAPTYDPPGGVTVLHGQASGMLTAGYAATFPGASTVEVRTGDIDGDENTDAILATTSGFRVATGDATTGGAPLGTLTVREPFDGPLGAARLLLADFDEDGRDDVVTSRAVNNPDIFETNVRRSLGGGALSAPEQIPGGFHHGMDWGDIDDDGLMDLILAQSYDGVRVAYGTGDGGFEDHTVYPVVPDDVQIVRLVSVVAGDFSGDGVHDVAAGDAYSAHGRLLALRNAPFLTFDAESVDFGAVASGGTARRTLEIGNAGVADLNAEAVDVAGPEFGLRADACKGNAVPAGATCAVELSFTPPAPDFYEGSLLLASDDPEPLLEVLLEGAGVPALSNPAPPSPPRPTPSAPDLGPTASRATADALAAATKALGRRGLRRIGRRRGVRFALNAPVGTIRAVLAAGPRVLARARARAPSPGRLTVTLRPTLAGRRVAHRGRPVKVTLRITVKPDGRRAVTRSAAFTLRR